MRRATIYKFENELFISSSSQTTEGFWVDNGYISKVSIDHVQDIKVKVEDALSNSKLGFEKKVSTQTDLDDLVKPILELSNTSTWASFSKKAKSICVSKKGNILKLMPTRRSGKEYKHLPKQTITVTDNFYESLLKCLDIAK